MWLPWAVTKQKCEIFGDINLKFLVFMYKVVKTSGNIIAAALKDGVLALTCIIYNML
jgi:hypothetical protein